MLPRADASCVLVPRANRSGIASPLSLPHHVADERHENEVKVTASEVKSSMFLAARKVARKPFLPEPCGELDGVVRPNVFCQRAFLAGDTIGVPASGRLNFAPDEDVTVRVSDEPDDLNESPSLSARLNVSTSNNTFKSLSGTARRLSYSLELSARPEVWVPCIMMSELQSKMADVTL